MAVNKLCQNGRSDNRSDSQPSFAEFWQPGRIVSLWDMLEQIFLIDVAHSYSHLGRLISQLERKPEPRLSVEEQEHLSETLEIIERGLMKAVPSESIRRAVSMLGKAIVSDGRTAYALELSKELRVTVRNRLVDAVCFLLPENATKYLAEEAVPKSIKDKLPQSASDLAEANALFAYGAEKACVYHCLCALEPLLPTIAKKVKHLGGKYDLKNTLVDTWGQIIDKLDAELKQLPKRPKSPKRNAEIQRLSEMCNQMRAVKGAWRDGAMHARREFSSDEAKNILNQCTVMIQYVVEF